MTSPGVTSALQILDAAPPYRLVKGRHGWFLANPNDTYIGRSLLTYGEYCEPEWKLLEQLLVPGFDAIEIGANIGSHTVPMAKKLAELRRRLIAVEPQPLIYQNLCANLALNALTNVMASNIALSDHPGIVTFGAPGINQEFNFGSVSMREDTKGNGSANAVRLDDFLPPNFKLGLIKLDVEGHEQKVLEGARQTIARCRPMIYLENDRIDKSQALIEWLWSANYKMSWHVIWFFNPDNFAGDAKNIYSNKASINMLALPRELPATLAGFVEITNSREHPFKPAA